MSKGPTHLVCSDSCSYFLSWWTFTYLGMWGSRMWFGLVDERPVPCPNLSPPDTGFPGSLSLTTFGSEPFWYILMFWNTYFFQENPECYRFEFPGMWCGWVDSSPSSLMLGNRYLLCFRDTTPLGLWTVVCLQIIDYRHKTLNILDFLKSFYIKKWETPTETEIRNYSLPPQFQSYPDSAPIVTSIFKFFKTVHWFKSIFLIWFLFS